MYLFLMVPWVGLWSVIVAFPGHTHRLFMLLCLNINIPDQNIYSRYLDETVVEDSSAL